VNGIKQLKLVPKGIRRGNGGLAQPWNEIVLHYKDLVENYHWQFEPMLGLVEALAASTASCDLFPTTSMHRLLVTDSEKFHHDDNVLFVSYDQKKKEFEFEHRTLSGKNDKKICDKEDALETLRLFLKYKFGVLFDSKAKAKNTFGN
jgi:hypothetical protein